MTRKDVTGDMAHVLAGRLTAQGYQVEFPVGRDPAAFMVTSLPGDPDVEITAEDGGQTSCHYTGRSPAEAASTIARLRAPGHPPDQAVTSDTLVGTWDGIAVEWHYLPPEGQPANADQISTALLAHLAILTGSRSRGTDLANPRARQSHCRARVSFCSSRQVTDTAAAARIATPAVRALAALNRMALADRA